MGKLCLFALALVALCSNSNDARAATFFLPWTDAVDHYELDDQNRTVAQKGKLVCPDKGFVRYAGTVVRLDRPAIVHTAFAARMKKFEAIVRDVAMEHYGRAPTRMRHLGTLACRRIRGYPTWLSEHALGNAIDIAAFDFPAASAALRKSNPNLPPRAFRVSILDDWQANPSSRHGLFLHALAKKLVDSPEVFRVLLGPAYPGHKNHFHFDMGPYRLIEM
jgi:hypothetical protein